MRMILIALTLGFLLPPAPVTLGVHAKAYASADTAKYTVAYVLNKALRTGDSVRVRVTRDSTALVKTAFRFNIRDSASFLVNKIYGRPAKYNACVRVQHGAYQPVAKCVGWTTNLADTTPPTVDSVAIDSSQALSGLMVWPHAPTLAFGQRQQFCAFAVFRNGQLALRGAEQSIPTCDSAYFSLAAQSIKPSPQQQYVANHLCVSWAATGGFIQAQTCGVPS